MPLKEETDFQQKKLFTIAKRCEKYFQLQRAGINKPLMEALQTNLIPVALYLGREQQISVGVCGLEQRWPTPASSD